MSNHPLMTIKNPVSKRIFDLMACTGLLLVAAPLMIIVALLIMIEQRCNPIFSQRRTGLGGNEFTIYKFRTMSDSAKGIYSSQTRGDAAPRITALGKILRDTSIDELPQLFNVLKGNMSLVGPRPQMTDYLPYYGSRIPNYHKRLLMKPGITGLMQITPLRYKVDSVENYTKGTHYELYYIRHWSLWLDIWICWKTALVVLNPKIISEQGKYFKRLRTMTIRTETEHQFPPPSFLTSEGIQNKII